MGPTRIACLFALAALAAVAVAACETPPPAPPPSASPSSMYWNPPPPPPLPRQALATPADAAAPPPSLAGCGRPKLTPGRTSDAAPPLGKPKRGVFYDEPQFHTCIARATDHRADGAAGFSRNDYSRRQAFNADSTLFITNAQNGAWFLYDAATLLVKSELSGISGDAEPQWDPKDPNTLYYGERNGGLVIKAKDVRTGNAKPFIDLNGKLPWPSARRAWTKSEGSPSADGRYWGFQVETDDFKILGFAVWDTVANKLVGSTPSKSRPDHVSMSPSGRWLVVSGDETFAYSRDFKQKKPIRKGGEHSDLAIGLDGHDEYVSIDYDEGGFLFFFDIDTGKRTDLFRTYLDGAATALHFSGRAFDKPGWALVSTYDGGGPHQWYMDKVFIVELAANPRIYELAAHRCVRKDEYFAEPHASVNRTFTRVLFNSNWGAKNPLDIDAYLIRIPEGSFP